MPAPTADTTWPGPVAMNPERKIRLLRRVRRLTALFILGLLLSGATAIPLESELNWLVETFRLDQATDSPLADWMLRVRGALQETNAQYPFIAYGGDWLAFGHFMIALVFVWAWREPVRNRWLFNYGLLACALVVPYAWIMGGVREIPLWWRGVDSLFGVIGAVPLWFCRRYAAELAREGRGSPH